MQKETSYQFIHICIPAYKEENIIKTLNSLELCDVENLHVAISILVNEPENAGVDVTNVNQKCIKDIQSFQAMSSLNISFLHQVFPEKIAGVGLARKTLMDKASADYIDAGINGLIVALDADTIVLPNYLQEVSSYFAQYEHSAASIFYEHPLDCKEIIEYEYHLRYYNSMQFHAGFPFAYHTVGSAMVCTAKAYKDKGGMNKRKAGEDFYFMQKFIKDQVCGNITKTTLIPSSRESDRVPFGTGRAVLKYTDETYSATTYNPLTFDLLAKLNILVSDSYDKPQNRWTEDRLLAQFLQSIDFNKNMDICIKNTKDKSSFLKRYYQFFDAFKLMKCLHFMRENYPDISIEAAARFYQEKYSSKSYESVERALIQLRVEERIRFESM